VPHPLGSKGGVLPEGLRALHLQVQGASGTVLPQAVAEARPLSRGACPGRFCGEAAATFFVSHSITNHKSLNRSILADTSPAPPCAPPQ
jgi:hypothetical protein